MSKPFASNPIGWAFYLACSWTWCIGMFLPALLLRDFGTAGFLCFAIPNVLGAAGMGFILKDRAASDRVVAAHRPMIQLFSLVTIFFHLAWLLLVVFPLGQQLGRFSLAIPTLLLFTFAFAIAGGPRSAIVVYIVSALAAVMLFTRGWIVPTPELQQASFEAGRLPTAHILGLAPACALGFLLCPYLDGTFHLARAALDRRAAKIAFGLGFGVFFLGMILFTAYYAPVFTPRFTPDAPKPDERAVFWLLLHLCIQASFTIGVHLRELMRLPPGAKTNSPLAKLAVASIFITAMMTVSRVIANQKPPALFDAEGDSLSWYRMFMGAYALFFPAYVWLCMMPGRGRAPSPEQTRVWLLASMGATPMMYFAFVERQTLWALPAVALVLIARRFVRPAPASPEPSLEPSTSPDLQSPPAGDRPRLSLVRPPEDEGAEPLEDRRG
jgi:hypothetical protein